MCRFHCKKGLALAFLVTALLLLCVGCSELLPFGKVKIGGRYYDKDTTHFIVTQSDFADYQGLRQLAGLKVLDLSALRLSPSDYEAVASQIDGQVSVVWRVPLGEKRFLCTQEELVLTPEALGRLKDNAGYFTALRQVSVEEVCPLTEELAGTVEALRQAHPGLSVQLRSQVYGVDVSSETETLVLNGIRISDLAPLHLAVRVFPNIGTFEMCECGLPDETMAGLRQTYPDRTFTWIVVCGRYQLRTDALVFSTLVSVLGHELSEKEFAPIFRYCTELRALDLGHQMIADISEITNLKKMQVLILADNHITDISPLAELPDLHYLELFQNQIEDLSPIQKLTKLEDINFMYNYGIRNADVVLEMPQLKRVYLNGCGLKDSKKKAIKDAFIHFQMI